MFETLEKLRQKSDSQKKKIAFSFAFTFALIILGVWVTVIFPDFINKQKIASKQASTTSPIVGIVSVISSGFGQIGETFNSLKQAVSSLSTTSTYYNSVANPTYSASEK